MMYAIDGLFDFVEVKVYDVRIFQGQAPTSDVVERDLVVYGEFDSTRGHLPE